MLVKTIEALRSQGGEVVLNDGQVKVVRFLTKRDGLGVAMSDVRPRAGTETVLWYKHHWEANYIVSGRGTVTNVGTGESWVLSAGTIYTVGPHDQHRLDLDEDTHILSIFNPALVGDEKHDEDGAYAPSGEVLPGRGTMFVKTLEGLRAAGREKVVAGGSARSIRILLQEDNVGFTLSDVNLKAGNKNTLWYKHHWEANYILQGSGEVSDLTTGESWPMQPGMMYIVGPTDRHSMHAHTDLHLISIFNPPLQGDELHDDEGTLSPSGPLPPGLPVA